MQKEIISQYRASLAMLADVVEKCPDELWNDTKHENTYWRIVYHSLFYTALYLSKSAAEFIPWEKHIANYNTLDAVSRDNIPIIIDAIYSKEELLSYVALISGNLENTVIESSLHEKSGFEWIPMSNLALHFYTIRHLQHHTGQLTERLHEAGIKGIRWVGMG